MKTNRNSQIGPPRFRTAIHILVSLAKDGTFLSSASIACAVNSHATFLRRILASLAQANIVEAREGREGGYGLKLPPNQITLADIYLAISTEDTECAKIDAENCSHAEKLDKALEELLYQADQRKMDYLRQFTIQDVMQDLV